MVTIASLWLAILLSSALVWLASAVVWMLLPHHKSEYKQVANEEAARSALRGLAPGQYNIPHVTSPDELKKPEGLAKFNDGPVGFLTILPSRVPAMGKNMATTFVFYAVVGLIVAYLSTRTLDATAEYLAVFRLTGTIAWLSYGMAVVPDAVWFGRPWASVLKTNADALLYAVLTAGVFAWLWPN